MGRQNWQDSSVAARGCRKRLTSTASAPSTPTVSGGWRAATSTPLSILPIFSLPNSVSGLRWHFSAVTDSGHWLVNVFWNLAVAGGGVLLEYMGYGVSAECLHGTDLLPGRLKDAHAKLPHLPLTNADGQSLPYRAGVFDLALQYTVFSSILDADVKAGLAREMLRVLKPGGMILWYDFWLNPTNPQTHGIQPAEIRRLFPNCRYEFRRITLAPPLARLVVKVSWMAAYALERLTIFNSHYLVAIQSTDN